MKTIAATADIMSRALFQGPHEIGVIGIIPTLWTKTSGFREGQSL